MLGGILDELLKIIQHMYLHFIGASSIDNMLSRYLLNYLLNKKINCTKLFLFDIYVTYNLQAIWTSYSEERLVIASVVCTSEMNIWTSVVPVICFDMVELHCPDRVMQQFSYKQNILVNINTSDASHAIIYRSKNDYYDQLGQYRAYVSQWDAWRNEIFTQIHHMINDEEYMIWYMGITQ